MQPDIDFISARLKEAPVFMELPEEELARLATEVEVIHLMAGATLTEQGEDADGAYLLLSGRLHAFAVQPDGSEAPVGDIGTGELVGEMALLSATTRGATVRALRDSQLIFVKSATFERIVHVSPQATLAIARGLVDRLQRANTRRPATAPSRSVTLMPANGACSETIEALIGALGETATTVVYETDKEAALGTDHTEAELVTWLNQLEAEAELLIYVAGDPETRWTGRCLRQADHILAIDADPGNGEISHLIETLEALTSGAVGPVVDAVCVHPPRAGRAGGGWRWVSGGKIGVHHTRRDHADDHSRVARALLGKDIGLVLSGGGARGLAHVGVMRALDEAGIPIDIVGGTSFGSIAAMMRALDMTWEEMREVLWDTVGRNGAPIDITAPAISFSKGQRLRDVIDQTYTDANIEDTWLRSYCVSSNLSSGHSLVHRTGPIASAVRASVAIPGVFPPVASGDGEVLVDGAVMNNLPVDVMTQLSRGGPIVAVNLRSPAEMPARQLPGTGVVSGWQTLWRRLTPFGATPEMPTMLDILARSNEMSGAEATRALEETATYVLHPPTGGHAFLDFGALDELIETGYRHTLEQIDEWDEAGWSIKSGG